MKGGLFGRAATRFTALKSGCRLDSLSSSWLSDVLQEMKTYTQVLFICCLKWIISRCNFIPLYWVLALTIFLLFLIYYLPYPGFSFYRTSEEIWPLNHTATKCHYLFPHLYLFSAPNIHICIWIYGFKQEVGVTIPPLMHHFWTNLVASILHIIHKLVA